MYFRLLSFVIFCGMLLVILISKLFLWSSPLVLAHYFVLDPSSCLLRPWCCFWCHSILRFWTMVSSSAVLLVGAVSMPCLEIVHVLIIFCWSCLMMRSSIFDTRGGSSTICTSKGVYILVSRILFSIHILVC